MKNFFKKSAAFVGFFILAAIVTASDAQVGAVFAVVVMSVAGWAVVKPIPRIGLKSRAYSAAVAVAIGLFTLSLANEKIKVQDPAYMAALKMADPKKYLSTLRIHDHGIWLLELEEMDPARFAAEQLRKAAAGTDAAQARAAREAAAAEAARLAVEATRIAVEEAAAQAAADAVVRREQSMATIRQSIELTRYEDARSQMEALNREGGDLTDFRAEMEASVLAVVKPLPAGDLENNRKGYALLAAIQPSDLGYPSRAGDYAGRIEHQRAAAVSLMRTKEDKVEGITWYQHPNQPKYTNSRSTVYLYIGQQRDSRPWLRMQVQYAAGSWLFVERVIAWHDGVREPLIGGSFERDNHSTIWEWRDVAPDAYQIEVLRSLAAAREAVLRFEGRQYKRDVTLSAGDKKAILETLLAFEVMRAGS